MGIGNNEMNNRKNESTLIFNLGLTTFSYTIFNENKVFENICTSQINQYDTELNLQTILKSHEKLQQPFSKCIGSISSNSNTFIPKALFDPKHITHYINFNSFNSIATLQLYNEQIFTDCYSIFSIEKKILKMLKTVSSDLRIKHAASIFVDYAISLSTKIKDEIFIDLDKKCFQITYIKDSKFIFYNQFNFINHNEFLYHYLNCINILNIDLKKININVMSSLEKNHVIFEDIRKYTTNMKFINRLEVFNYSNEILKTEEHTNHKLFSQLVCA